MPALGERIEHFRPDIEGLRAIAVVLVLLYHADIPLVAGGYVGVDVFFVISGFLITGLLLRELESSGRLSFGGFYARRVRRLLPASALTLLVTLIASLTLLSPLRLPDVAADIASAAGYISNFRFGLAANDYFQANAAPSPVIHFWSLSVEEQFYLVWPAVLLVLFTASTRVRHVGRSAMLIAMGLLSGTSLVLCIWLTGIDQAWAFYLLPTRAWELGAGALLAIGAGHMKVPGVRMATALATLGLAAVAAAALSFTDRTAFPGYAAILPVAGTAAVIFAGTRREPIPARLLALRPLTFLGRISYSVYLWHWPILLFAAVLYGHALPWPLALLLAFASIPVAAVTQRFVESPFRAGRFITTRPRLNLVQAVASALVLAVLAGAAAFYATANVSIELTALQPPVADPQPKSGGWCIPTSSVDDMSSCVHGNGEGLATIILFGDSQAEQWYYPLRQIAADNGWRFVSLTRPSCYPEPFDVAYPAEKDCPDWREHAYARIAAERPDIVVLSSHARSVVIADGRVVDGSLTQNRPVAMRVWGDALSQALERLQESAGRVAIIGETPLPGQDVPSCLALHSDDFGLCARPVSSIPRDWHLVDERVAAEAGATFIDPTQWLCTSDSCPAVIGSYLVYWDEEHLSEPFSASLAGRIAAALPPLGQAASSQGPNAP